MLLYLTSEGPVLNRDGSWFSIQRPWNDLVNDDALFDTLNRMLPELEENSALASHAQRPLAPITNQEIWAAGVTYFRSKTARMEESQDAGGGDFYDRVYDAQRPEIFFKATPQRTVGTGGVMHRRSDSKWIVPEPELTLVITRTGKIIGYTVGNDLSCRDIEGENPLYLPQAKSFDRCASIGPAILIAKTPPANDTQIKMTITRAKATVFQDQTEIAQIKRGFEELAAFLFRDNAHPNGCLLMTGTGIIPPDEFSLETGDVVEIQIDGIGKLVNSMD
jgi:2-dehydro-3-deoxy-D-arabinonate dehydratase